MSEMWAWTAIDPLTDTEGIISARHPRGMMMPLVGAVEHIVRGLQPIAEAVVRDSAEPRPVLRLRHFVADDDGGKAP
jgi:hypothetical protein